MHKRLFYLDNLKTFALLLGVLFHTSIVYAPGIGYAIKSRENNFLFYTITHLIHVFRMPLFFFLSGFFSYMVLNNKGGRSFTFSRIERMLAPMLVGLILFAPIQYYLEYNQTHSPISFFKYYIIFFSIEEFNFSHIWFLVYLSLFSFLLLLNYRFRIIQTISLLSFQIFKLFKKPSKKLNNIFTVSKKFTFYFLSKSYLILFLQGVIFCFFVFYFTNMFFNKDDSIFKIQPVSFFYYFSFFMFGVLFYKNKILQNFTVNPNLKIQSLILYLVGIVFLFCLFLYFDRIDPYWMNFTYEVNRFLIRGLHLLSDSILAWSFIFLLLHFFKKYLDTTSSILDYLRNSGMSIYLIHHPISLILADNLKVQEIPLGIKFFIHLFLVFVLSFFFYHFLIKKSFLLKRVFGTK